MKRVQCIFLISAMLLSYGCANNKAIDNSATQTNINDEKSYVKITKQELETLKMSSQQWQNMKPELARLLLIEEDLSLLILQLNTIAKENEQKNAPVIKAESVNTNTINRSNLQVTKPVNPKFALQVLSITQKEQLSLAFRQLQKKLPSLLGDNFVMNVETINVKGVMYNRLKLGAYIDKKNAMADCQKLKSQNISCLVSYYVDQPFIAQ